MTSDEPWTSEWRLCVSQCDDCSRGLALVLLLLCVTTPAKMFWLLTALQSVKWRRRRAIQQWVAVVKTQRDDAAPNRYGELCGQHVPYVAQGTRVKRARLRDGSDMAVEPQMIVQCDAKWLQFSRSTVLELSPLSPAVFEIFRPKYIIVGSRVTFRSHDLIEHVTIQFVIHYFEKFRPTDSTDYS